MTDYIVSLDVGTTNVRSFIYNNNGVSIYTSTAPVDVLCPEPGASEIDPAALWSSIHYVVSDVVNWARSKNLHLRGLGISLQRNTGTFWHADSFKLLSNFITWQDVRCKADVIQANTSISVRTLNATSSFLHFFVGSITKRFLAGAVFKCKSQMASPRIVWLMKKLNVEAQAAKGEVVWGCLDSWILRKMNNNQFEHISEITNAGASGIFDPFTVKWSWIALLCLGIPQNCLPRVVPTVGTHFGSFAEFGLPILGVAGDTNAAMFGERMTAVGDIKITMGTGAFVDLNTGLNPYPSILGAYPLIGWQLKKDGVITYLAEADDSACGAAIDWAARAGFYPSAKIAELMARQVKDTAGVHFIPALWGLSSPINDPSAKCALLGLGPGTQQQHCVRAILHAIAFRSVQLVETLKNETKIPLKRFSIDGGVSNNDLICEKIASLTKRPLRRAVDIDASARGAAFFAGIAADIWTEETLPEIPLKDIVHPISEDSEYLFTEYAHWKDSIKRTLKWSQMEFDDSDETDSLSPEHSML